MLMRADKKQLLDGSRSEEPGFCAATRWELLISEHLSARGAADYASGAEARC